MRVYACVHACVWGREQREGGGGEGERREKEGGEGERREKEGGGGRKREEEEGEEKGGKQTRYVRGKVGLEGCV